MRFRDAMPLSRRLACVGAAALTLASLSCGPPATSRAAKAPADTTTTHQPTKAPPPEVDATAPLELTIWARTEGSTRGPFKNAMRLQQGDQLYFDGQASKQAYVYMLHCDEKQALERIPQRGYIPLSARQRSAIPEQYQYFEVDDHVGEEVIYVVASERPLADDGPTFYDALTRGPQQEAVHLDCGRRPITPIAAPSSSTPRPTIRHKPPPPAPPAPSLAVPVRGSAEASAAPPEQPGHKPPDPVPTTLRGTPLKGGASVSTTRADQAGIVVMRFTFEH